MKKVRKIVIHHLSDIHFGKFQELRMESPVLGERACTRITKPFADCYIDLLKKCTDEDRPHFVVISGDIASVGDKKELIEGVDFCRRITDALGEKQEDKVILVPGNHDTNWNASRLEARIKLFKDLFENYPTPFSPPSKKGVCYYKEFNVIFWAINSVKLSGAENKAIGSEIDKLKGLIKTSYDANKIGQVIADIKELNRIDPGSIDLNDLDSYEAEYKGLTKKHGEKVLANSIKCAILHHPVSSMLGEEAKPFSNLINGGKLKSFLQSKGFDIVLHGHGHEHGVFYEDLHINSEQQGIHVIAAGSLAGKGVANKSFNRITVYKNKERFAGEIERLSLTAESSFEPFPIGRFYRKNASIDKLILKYPEVFIKHHKADQLLLQKIDDEIAQILSMHRYNEGYVKVWMQDYEKYIKECSRAFAVDIQGIKAWKTPLFYYYLSLQFYRNIHNVVKNESGKKLTFSHSICKAINCANKNAKKSKLTYEQEPMFANSEVGIPTFEMARIIIWKKSALINPDAKAFIDLHDYFQIPLFYLDGGKLRHVRNHWNKVEYIIFQNDPSDRSKTKGLWIEPSNDELMKWDENVESGQIYLKRSGGSKSIGYPSEDFEELLKRKNIMFARDAYELIKEKGTLNNNGAGS